ncbi:MAG: DHHA1 domain-containing protein [Candidatus Methanomethyliaceae archaeon]|nr:DHHA1 domain-containing protein [Candidatus Methanomethyliaceae archaeon]
MIEWIITHGDSDGICSGALALAAYKNAKLFFSHPIGLADDLRQVDGDVIICDIALPAQTLDKVHQELTRIDGSGHKTVYIDHHPFPPNFDLTTFPWDPHHSVKASAAEQTFSTLQERLTRDYSRVAIYGAIGDYLDRTPKIEEWLMQWDKRSLYLESGLLIQAIDSMGRNYELKREVARYLANNNLPSQDEKIVNRAISEAIREEEMRGHIEEVVKVVGKVAYVLDIDWSLSKSAIYSRAQTGALVGIGAETRDKYIDMSLRTHSDKLDLNGMVIAITQKIGGSGGGHPMAAGAKVPKEKFKIFVEELNHWISVALK